MTIEVFWDNPERTIIRQDLRGQWTSEEYLTSVMTMYDTMKSVPHRVHIVVDMTHTDGHSTRMMAAAPRLNTLLPANRGLTVGINIPTYLVAIVRVGTRLYPRLGRHVHFASTLDQAYSIIKKYGAHLY